MHRQHDKVYKGRLWINIWGCEFKKSSLAVTPLTQLCRSQWCVAQLKSSTNCKDFHCSAMVVSCFVFLLVSLFGCAFWFCIVFLCLVSFLSFLLPLHLLCLTCETFALITPCLTPVSFLSLSSLPCQIVLLSCSVACLFLLQLQLSGFFVWVQFV